MTTTPTTAIAVDRIGGGHLSPWRRFFGVAWQGHTYRRIAYLLLGLPLGTVWFAVLTSVITTSASLLVVALLGIPMLWATWYAVRAFANVERRVADVLLGERIPVAPFAGTPTGNVWKRLRVMSGERDRWRELAYLVLRFPAGIITFTAAVVALATPVIIAIAPVQARVATHPFGHWTYSGRMEDMAASPWSWLLVPIGVGLLFVALHLLNRLAAACGRWSTAWLSAED